MSGSARFERGIVGETVAGFLGLGQAEQARRHRIYSIGRQQLGHLLSLYGIMRRDDQLPAAQVPAREAPDARLGEFDRIAGGIAKIKRASAALPFELRLDGDTLCCKPAAPLIDLRGACRKARVAGSAS